MKADNENSMTSRKRLFARFDLNLVADGTWAALSGSAGKVYIALLSRANFKTGRCWPSAATIAKDSGLSRITVHRALNELIQFGLIDKSKMKGFSNRYKMESSNEKNVTSPISEMAQPCSNNVTPPVTKVEHKLYPKNHNHLTTPQRTTDSSSHKHPVQENQMNESKRDPRVESPVYEDEPVDEPMDSQQPRTPQLIGTTILKYMAKAKRDREAGRHQPDGHSKAERNVEQEANAINPDHVSKLADLFYQGGNVSRKDVPREQVEQWAAKKLQRWPARQIAQVIQDHGWPDHPKGFDKMLYRRPTRDQLTRRRDAEDHHRRKKLTNTLNGLVLHLTHYDPPAGWARSALRFFNISKEELCDLARRYPNPDELYRQVVKNKTGYT